jgi:hypothetical protein
MKHVLFLAMAVTLATPIATHAQTITPPAVPSEIEVLEPNEVFLIGHAIGTQNYECQPAATLGRVAWTLFTPEATLFGDLREQLTTHFFSPNPIEKGVVVRATWQDSADTSTIWAKATGSVVPDTTAVAWLRLEVVGARVGPTGGDGLSRSTFVQRINTKGGVAPATGCDTLNDVGAKAFQPYTADYVFYRQN